MSWSKEEIIRLIEEFKKQEVLWNPSAFPKRSPAARNQSWDYLATKFNRHVLEIRKKISSLLASYRRSRLQERKVLDQPFTPTWDYYKYFSFMNERRKIRKAPRKKNNNLLEINAKDENIENSYQMNYEDSQIIDDISDESFDDCVVMGNCESEFSSYNQERDSEFYVSRVINLDNDLEPLPAPKQERSFSPNERSSVSVLSDVASNHSDVKINNKNLTSSLNDSSEFILNSIDRNSHSQETSNSTTLSNHNQHQFLINSVERNSLQIQPSAERSLVQQEAHVHSASTTTATAASGETTSPLIRNLGKDECDAFGEYISCKLRSYPDKTKNIVQHYINNIIFEADMGKYE